MDWTIIDLLREKESEEWEPLPLYIDLEYPEYYEPPEDDKDEDSHGSVIIIEI